MSEATKKVAVICEYNPFHEGHALLISRARELYPNCTVISIMSGNTVQRGDFALYDRYTRARAATACGSDLTLELPYPFSASSSKQFARAGVRIAMEAGADVLIFGTLADNTDSLFHAANIMKTEEFDRKLGKLATAHPSEAFIKLRATLYRDLAGEELPTDGNSSLGIEYIMAAEEFSSRLQAKPLHCHPIIRTGDVSATRCRSAIREFGEIPSDIPLEAKRIFFSSPIGGGLEALGEQLLFFLRITAFYENYKHGDNDSNGIRRAIINAATSAVDFPQFNASLPTTTYTRARLRRELMDMLLLPDIPDTDALKNQKPQYTVLLDANEKGLSVLRQMKRYSSLPVITKPKDTARLSEEARKAYRIAERAESLFSLTFTPHRPPSELIPRFSIKQCELL